MSTVLGPLVDGQSRLRSGYKTLSETWAVVKEDWRDGRREQFQREYLNPLGPSLTRLSNALDDLRECIVNADRELADTGDDAN
jgi:ribulose kinase